MDFQGLAASKRVSEKQKQLLALLKEQKAQRGLQDLYFFDKFILGYDLMCEQPHRGMTDFIQHKHSRKKLILEPRGSFKSSVCTIGYVCQQILKNPNIRVLLDSQDLAESKKFLAEIKGHFETNEEFLNLYGDQIGKTWTDSEIIVKGRTKVRKEPTVLTGGVETPRVGLHFDLIIGDDYHSEHNVNTAEQIEKVISHWKLNASILEPEGEEVIIGTRWLIGDLYEEIMDKERQRRKDGLPPEYLVRRKSAIDKHGNLHFPTRLTKEFLEDMRIRLGSAFFACQYLNNPVDEGATLFKKNWMKFYGQYPPNNMTITAVLDPAISIKDGSCDSAFTIMGTDEDGYMYLLDSYFLKDTPDKIVDMMFKIQDLHNPYLFGIEGVAFQKTLKYWVWERMRQTGKIINVQELKTDTSVTKDMRIKALVPFMESGSILWPGDRPDRLHGNMLKLWDQVTQYPMTKFIDGIDSLAYHLQIVNAAPIRKKKEEPKKGVTPNDIIQQERRARLRFKTRGGIPVIGQYSVAPMLDNLFEVSR